jgi:hypothetical protein
LLYARGRGPLFVVFALGRRLGTHLSVLMSRCYGATAHAVVKVMGQQLMQS